MTEKRSPEMVFEGNRGTSLTLRPGNVLWVRFDGIERKMTVAAMFVASDGIEFVSFREPSQDELAERSETGGRAPLDCS